MNKIKLLKESVYMEALDIEFIKLTYFDFDDERLLYSLEYVDNNYNTNDFLFDYYEYFDEETVNNKIKTFMLNYIESQISCDIEENEYKGWKVEVIENGLKLSNDKTQQSKTWDIFDLDEDYEKLQSEIMKFLESNNQQNKGE